MFWRKWKREPQRDASTTDGARRLEVLESTEVDPSRRLVLVRCDEVEHLIMVGGPADLVVENDVRRRRAAPRVVARPAVQEQQPRPEPPLRDAQPRLAQEPALTPAEPASSSTPARSSVGGAEPPAAPQAARKSEQPAPAVQPAGRNGQAATPPPGEPQRQAAPAAVFPNPRALLREERRRRARDEASQRPAPAQADAATADKVGARGEPTPPDGPPGGVRDVAPAAALPQAAVQPPRPAAPPSDSRLRLQPVDGGRRDAEPGERRPRANRDEPEKPRETPRPASLPTAAVPWAESDSIEKETVRALRVEPKPPAAPPVAPAAAPAAAVHDAKPAARATSETPTTLGDLADRLEEALAREVQSTGAGRAPPEIDLDSFGFGRERESRNRTEPLVPPAPKERTEPRAMPPNPEPEPRRELRAAPERLDRPERTERQERQEETPVISLNARRREPVDPLEDEMARLLGELTGDTTRR